MSTETPPVIDMSKPGWLGWFYLMSALSIGISIYTFLQDWHLFSTVLAPASNSPESTQEGMLLITVADFFKAGFYAIIGSTVLVKMIRRSCNALNWLLGFLLIKLAASAILAGGGFYFGARDFAMEYTKIVLATIIWLLYFHESERVRLTFGRTIFERKKEAVPLSPTFS